MTQPGGGTYVRIQAVYLIQNVYTMLEILLTPVSSNLDIYIFLPFHPCYIQGGIRLRVQLKIANPVPYLSPIRMCLSDTENCVSIPSPLKKKKRYGREMVITKWKLGWCFPSQPTNRCKNTSFRGADICPLRDSGPINLSAGTLDCTLIFKIGPKLSGSFVTQTHTHTRVHEHTHILLLKRYF